ncbi:hypothetical protein CK203_107690 [Vitis vinifera]|uniref:Retrovirus-related Pol polyprotein from transposon TNT 1-94-like beta-barrel domain-containing protein n=1 Tax=Vitis vinifera TaxID=29760 RepID=A0A438CSQ0_VITVI|nr:hypothetical protein CK203_107690 [Vitis vinifera]
MTPRFDYVRMNCHSGNARDEQALKVSYGERYEGRGHFQYECPSWEKSANYVEFDEEEEMLLMSYVEVNNSKRENVWFLDSGCNNHMCGNRQWFSNIDEAFRHSVKLDNNKRMRVMGKGNIRLEINGSTQVVIDVYYVHALKNNLLNKDDNKSDVVLLANVVLETSTCLQTVTEDNSKLWHVATQKCYSEEEFSGELPENCNLFMLISAALLLINPTVTKDSVEGEDAFSESEEKVVEGIEAVVTDQEAEATTPTSIESCNEVAPIQAETRIRRAPPYLQDYVTGEGLSEDADVNNLAMFISHEDPGSFEEAKRDVKWRRAMDLEIEAIEKNET